LEKALELDADERVKTMKALKLALIERSKMENERAGKDEALRLAVEVLAIKEQGLILAVTERIHQERALRLA